VAVGGGNTFHLVRQLQRTGLMQAIRQRHADRLRAAFIRSPWLLKLIIFAMVIQLIVNISQDNVRPFIYAQF
jgi:hypothetical protein